MRLCVDVLLTALLASASAVAAGSSCPELFVESVTVPGKCYSITYYGDGNFHTHYPLLLLEYCRGLVYGADILAIQNVIENYEVVGLLEDRNVTGAYIGLQVLGAPYWYPKKGYSTYLNGLTGTETSGDRVQITSNGSWVFNDNGWPAGQILCQFYPDDPTSFPSYTLCPDGGIPSVNVPNKCFFYGPVASFDDASRYCEVNVTGSELVTLESANEDVEVYNAAVNVGNYWINYGRLGNASDWHWMGSVASNYTPGSLNSTQAGPCATAGDGLSFTANDCLVEARTVCSRHVIPCPYGWTLSDYVPNKCYFVDVGRRDRFNFTGARQYCREQHADADLLTVHRDDEVEEFYEAGYWIGLIKIGDTWQWINGDGGPIDLWDQGRPYSDKPSYTCGALYYEFVWNYYDYDCDESLGVICQLFVG